MGLFYAVLTAIIGSTLCLAVRAQGLSPGLMISSRGLIFDDYYSKSILTSQDSLLSGKAQFILILVDSICAKKPLYPMRLQNLHLVPPKAWPPVYYVISGLSLRAEKYPIVYTRSNRLISEEGFRLFAEVEVRRVSFSDTVKADYRFELPSKGWREALVDSLSQRLGEP